MFNEDRKRAFSQAYTHDVRNQKNCLVIFGKTGEFEEQFQCDVSQMTADQAKVMMEKICGASASSIRNMQTVLRAYTKWCKENNHPVSSHVFKFDIDASDAIRANYVASPLHLSRSLDYIFHESDDLNIQYLARAFLWLAYMGFEEDEVIRITPDHIDWDAMRIQLPSSNWYSYHIYSEAVRDLKMAVNLTSFVSKIGRGKKIIPRSPGSEILRTFDNDQSLEEMVTRGIRPVVSRACKAAKLYAEGQHDFPGGLCLNLSFGRVLQSGIFYRMYEEERLGITPSFSKFADIDVSKNFVDDGTKLMKRRIQTALSDTRIRYEQEYARWKNVYKA